MKQQVVVLGKNYSTALGVIRGLHQAGYLVDLVYVSGKKGDAAIAASSRYVHSCTEHVGRDDEQIIRCIQEKFGNRETPCVILPTDDYTASLIDRYADSLKNSFLMPHRKGHVQGSISELMDKSVQETLAGNFGLATVRSWTVDLSETDIHIPEDMVYPCFVKPLLSARGKKSELGKCETRAQLQAKLETMQKFNADRCVLIQEFLNITQEYAISGLCLEDRVIMPALIRKIDVAVQERGVTIVGELCTFETIADTADKLSAMLKSLEYTGLFDIDLLQCGDTLYFGEINLRSSGIGYSVIRSGANLPAILARELYSQDWSDIPCQVQYGQRFFYDKTGWEDYVYEKIRKKQLRSYIRKADFSLIADPEDPMPGRLLVRRMQQIRWKRMPKRLVRPLWNQIKKFRK